VVIHIADINRVAGVGFLIAAFGRLFNQQGCEVLGDCGLYNRRSVCALER
jgi:hypothetical protein